MLTASTAPHTATNSADDKQGRVPTLAQTRILHWMAQPWQSIRAVNAAFAGWPQFLRDSEPLSGHVGAMIPTCSVATLKALRDARWTTATNDRDTFLLYELTASGRDALARGMTAHAVALAGETARAARRARLHECGARIGEVRTQLREAQDAFLALGMQMEALHLTPAFATALDKAAAAMRARDRDRDLKTAEAELAALRMAMPG